MASITNRVNVAFTIPVEQTTTPTGDGQIRLNMRADITKTKRFFVVYKDFAKSTVTPSAKSKRRTRRRQNEKQISKNRRRRF